MSEASTKKKRKIFDKRFEILSVIGRGARSVVYHARHIDDSQEEIALKVILKSKKGTAPSTVLRKEALALVSSRHKYVIRLDDFHSLGDLCYLTLELAKKGDLHQYLKTKQGKLSPVQTELFLLQVAEALDFIHKAGILHRDLKPENLLVVDEQNIRVADFGIAMLPGEKSSFEDLQAGVGTLDYLSPEVLDGQNFDKRSDLYALGLSFYEILSGKHPFSHEPLAEQLEKRKDGNFVPIAELEPDAPAHLLSAITKLMCFNPEDRFQSAKELIQALVSFDVSGLDKTSSPAREKETAPSNTEHIEVPTATDSSAERTNAAAEDFDEQDQESSMISPAYEAPEIEEEFSQDGSDEDHFEEPESPPMETSSTGDKLLSAIKTNEPEEEEESSPPMHPPFFESAPALKQEKNIPLSSPETEAVPEPIASTDAPYNGGSSLASRAYLDANRETPSTSPQTTKPKQQKEVFSSGRKRRQTRKSRSRIKLIVALLISGAALYAASFLLKDSAVEHSHGVTKQKETKSSLVASEAVVATKEVSDPNTSEEGSILGDAKEPLVTFPYLPAGLYAGTLHFPDSNSKTTFSIIALNGSSQLIISLGIHGFHPVVVDLSQTPPNNNSLRVVSQGMILSLSGTVVDGALEGELKNEITGEIAQWRALP